MRLDYIFYCFLRRISERQVSVTGSMVLGAGRGARPSAWGCWFGALGSKCSVMRRREW